MHSAAKEKGEETPTISKPKSFKLQKTPTGATQQVPLNSDLAEPTSATIVYEKTSVADNSDRGD